jgi:hypothetical protein
MLFGEPGRDRTVDHLIKSQVLYHLSYGLAGAGVEAPAGAVNSERRGLPIGRRGRVQESPVWRPLPVFAP